jgi:hypothetical protein
LSGNQPQEKTVTNTQLLLAIAIPSLIPTIAVLLSILYNNGRFNAIDQRLIVIDGDLRQFYRDLGRHEGEINVIRDHVK